MKLNFYSTKNYENPKLKPAKSIYASTSPGSQAGSPQVL
jgi:hypothetical protein